MSTESNATEAAVMMTGYNVNDPRHVAATGPHLTFMVNLPEPMWRVECWNPYDPETGKGGRLSSCPEEQSLVGARQHLIELQAQHESEGKRYAHYDVVEYVYDLTYETTVHTTADTTVDTTVDNTVAPVSMDA